MPMKTWFTLWQRSLAIATGSPEVVSRRMQMLQQPAPWTTTNVLEAQNMVLEKVQAAGESWWALYRGSINSATLPAWGSAQWLQPATGLQIARRTARTAHQALTPISRRVNANVKRLRKG